MQVYSRSQGKIIEVPDQGFASQSQTQTVAQPQMQQTQQQGQKYITGRSLEEHAQALQKAKMARDKKAVTSITDDFDREFQYQKEYNPTDTSKNAANLRKEFAKETKDSNFRLAQDAYKRTKDVPNTGAGDLSLIYSYIKALDPTSVVREGEINISKATASVPENILTAYKRVKEGKLLSDQQRQEYKGEIGRFYNEKAKEQQQRNAFYSGLATDMQIDPQKVIGDVGKLELAQVSQATPTQQGNAGITGALGELLFNVGKSVAQPFVTTAKTGILAGQTAGVMGLKHIAPNLASKLGRADILGSQETARKFSEQPEEAFKEQLGASAQLAVPKLLGIAGKGLGTIGRKIAGTFSKGSIGAKQKAAEAAAGNLDTTALKQAGDYFVKKINPAANSSWKTLKTSIGKSTPASELMEKLTSYGSKGYNAAGTKSTIAEGELKRFLLEKGRELVKTQAPDVAKQTAAFRFLYDLPEKAKMAQKGTWLALKATAIGKMLGL